MNKLLKTVAAGTLSIGLLLGCSGCGNSVPDVTNPTVHKEPPPVTTTEATTPTVHKDPITSVTAGEPVSPHLLQLSNLTAAPEYPEMPKCPKQEDYPEGSQQFYEDQWQWQRDRYLYRTTSPENVHDLDPFMEEAMQQFLSGGDNQVCSPVNIYFALAMLAQTTGGSSRQQILEALGHKNMESLQTQSNQLWRAHYINDGQTVSLLANSVWLDEAYHFEPDTLDTLAKEHYASVFTGDLGTAEMDRQLAAWLDSQTGGLLSEYTQNIQLDPLTAFCLASTAYFKADWSSSFYEGNTQQQVFHSSDRDVTVDFMNTTFLEKNYYEGKDFSAVRLALSGNHGMWLILPDEGSSPDQLLKQGDYYDLISHPDDWEQTRWVTLNLSMPKFDVSSEQELIPGLKAMGITDVCDPQKADYSPITAAPLYLSQTQHAARVAVDEEGVVAAAYMLLAEAGCGIPEKLDEIDFTLDRPFLFTITGEDSLPLFAGVVAEP